MSARSAHRIATELRRGLLLQSWACSGGAELLQARSMAKAVTTKLPVLLLQVRGRGSLYWNG